MLVKCGHCKRTYYRYDDDSGEICPVCRLRLDTAMERGRAAGNAAEWKPPTVKPWQQRLFK